MKQNEIIKNVSENQQEILRNIMDLHNGGNGFDLDITYSKGQFYKPSIYKIAEPRIKMDVFPQSADVIKIEKDKKLPLSDESVSSIMIDLPFVVSCGSSLNEETEGINIISKRFSWYYPYTDLLESYKHWIKEAYRVLNVGGVLVFKTQATVSSGQNLFTPEYSWLVAESIGFYTLDQFFLVAKNRVISGKHKNQQHARKYTSTFYVFKKQQRKKRIDFIKYALEERV